MSDKRSSGDSHDAIPQSGSGMKRRDLLLSGTTILHRAFLRAGIDAQLVVFEALPHAFWYDYQLPETHEALDIMVKFFDSRLR